MLWDFYCSSCSRTEEHFVQTGDVPTCAVCFRPMTRLPGGHGLLYFEESRGRIHQALGDKPITSLAQQKREMRQRGLVESGNTVPTSVAKNPRSIGLQRFMEKDKGGRWI